MNDVIARYGSGYDFLTIYQKEAHPTGGWEAPDQPFKVADPASTAERLAIAKDFYAKLNMAGQLAVDGVDNQALLVYSSMPDRIFVVDRSHRFVYVQDKGPIGYQPDDLAKFLDANIVRP